MPRESRTQLNRALEALGEAIHVGEISVRDGRAITELADHELDLVEQKQLKEYTVRNHIRKLCAYSSRSKTDLVRSDTQEIQKTLELMKSGDHEDVKDSGIGIENYQTALRVFFRYHHDLGIDPSHHDTNGDPLKIDVQNGRNVSPTDLLYQKEVDDLLAESWRNTPRDMAFIAIALATGLRIDAIRTLRLKHIERTGPTMNITLNTEEGDLKGASGTKPLLWAKHYLQSWLDCHPHRSNPNAALFCPLPDNHRNGGSKKPISGETLRTKIKQYANDSCIGKNVYPHLFRHCAITRMVLEGLGEQQIKYTVGWSADSSRFTVYVNLADDITNYAIRESLEVPSTDTEVVIGKPTLTKCPHQNCGDEYPPKLSACPTCGGYPAKSNARKIVEKMSDVEMRETLELLEQRVD